MGERPPSASRWWRILPKQCLLPVNIFPPVSDLVYRIFGSPLRRIACLRASDAIYLSKLAKTLPTLQACCPPRPGKIKVRSSMSDLWKLQRNFSRKKHYSQLSEILGPTSTTSLTSSKSCSSCGVPRASTTFSGRWCLCGCPVEEAMKTRKQVLNLHHLIHRLEQRPITFFPSSGSFPGFSGSEAGSQSRAEHLPITAAYRNPENPEISDFLPALRRPGAKLPTGDFP